MLGSVIHRQERIEGNTVTRLVEKFAATKFDDLLGAQRKRRRESVGVELLERPVASQRRLNDVSTTSQRRLGGLRPVGVETALLIHPFERMRAEEIALCLHQIRG